jgi:hypothetical protein
VGREAGSGWGQDGDLGFGSVNGDAHLWRPEPGLRSQKQTSGPAVVVRAPHKRDTPVVPEPMSRSGAPHEPLAETVCFWLRSHGRGLRWAKSSSRQVFTRPALPNHRAPSAQPAHRSPGPGLRSQTQTVRPRQAARPKTSLPAQPDASASPPHNRTRPLHPRTTERVRFTPTQPDASASSPEPPPISPDPAASSSSARHRDRGTARCRRTRTRSAARPCRRRPIHGDVRGLGRC